MLSADPRHPDPPLTRLRRAALGVRRSLLARRRPLAALLGAVAVLAGLQAATQPPPPGVAVQVAAHDLPGGAVIAADDLATVDFAPNTVPDDLAPAPVGEVLASPRWPWRAGEPRTAGRGRAGRARGAGVVVLPVRLPDPEAAALLAVGDRIDLVATDPAEGGSGVVALGVRVLAAGVVGGACSRRDWAGRAGGGAGSRPGGRPHRPG